MEIKEDNFATILRYIRMNKGISKTELSRISSVSLPSIVRYENGERMPTLINALHLLNALGIRIETEQD